MRHRAVRDGAGASLLPCFLGDCDSALVRLLPPPSDLIEDVYLLLHERCSRGVRAVADALGQVFREGADILSGNHPGPATTGDDGSVPLLRSAQTHS